MEDDEEDTLFAELHLVPLPPLDASELYSALSAAVSLLPDDDGDEADDEIQELRGRSLGAATSPTSAMKADMAISVMLPFWVFSTCS